MASCKMYPIQRCTILRIYHICATGGVDLWESHGLNLTPVVGQAVMCIIVKVWNRPSQSGGLPITHTVVESILPHGFIHELCQGSSYDLEKSHKNYNTSSSRSFAKIRIDLLATTTHSIRLLLV